MNWKKRVPNSGFSLIELSIVLVIIALIAGGVMLGKDLIRAAQIRGQITQLQEIKSAFLTFRDRYDAIPGDMPDATDFWGIAGGATGIDAACYDTDSTTLADPKNTCNGNGDGWADSNQYCALADNCYYAERFRFWHHLSNAGLIEGTYTGRTGPLSKWNANATTGNVPLGKVRNSAIVLHPLPTQTLGNPQWFDNTGLSHQLGLGNLFTPEEAYRIDSKLDDGRPAYGNVLNLKKDAASSPNCTTANDPTAEYNLASTDKLCNIFFILMKQRSS